VEAMHLDKVGIYLLHNRLNQIGYFCYQKAGQENSLFPEQFTEADPLLVHLSARKGSIVTGEFKHQYGHLFTEGKVFDKEKALIRETLEDKLSASAVIPLWLKNNLIGFIALGEKKSGDHFTDRDLSLLDTISNQMVVVLENAKLYEQMLSGERLRVLGAMSASVAHEVRNPLAAIKTFIQMLPGRYEQPEFMKRFNEIVPAEVERLSRITEDLLTFARPSPPSLMPTDINAIADRVLTLLDDQIKKKQLKIEVNFGSLPLIQADGQQLTQVIMNLILNAIQASNDEGTIYVSTFVKSKPEAGLQPLVWFTVKDEGSGIKSKDLPSIFQPFFTTKHEGSGLGLATSKRIIEAHQGEILLASEEGRGAVFSMLLPGISADKMIEN